MRAREGVERSDYLDAHRPLIYGEICGTITINPIWTLDQVYFLYKIPNQIEMRPIVGVERSGYHWCPYHACLASDTCTKNDRLALKLKCVGEFQSGPMHWCRFLKSISKWSFLFRFHIYACTLCRLYQMTKALCKFPGQILDFLSVYFFSIIERKNGRKKMVLQ